MAMAVVLSVVTVWTAWDDGGGHRWTQSTASALVLVLIPFGFFAAWHQRFLITPTVVILALVVWLVSAFQCVPLPPVIVKALSPGSYEVYREWLPEPIREEAIESPDSPASTVAMTAIPISVSPTFTRLALSLPLLFAAGCWLSALCFGNRRAAVVLLLVPAVVGGLFAFFGLADMIRLARDSDVELRQRLIITPVGADGPFGPFINNNTCAGYLNLTIGCAVGLLLGMRHRAKETPSSGLFHHWKSIACVLLIIVMVTGILGSNSRGGFLGLMTATLALAFIGTRGWSRIGLIGGLVVIAIASLFFLDELGIRDRTSDRLETLYDGTATKNPRLRIWQDGLRASLAHLPMGAGFGTYRYAHMPYQKETGDHWAVNADGMHVEWLLEGGVWLIPVLLLGAFFVVRDTIRLARRIPKLSLHDARIARALTIAMTFSLSSLIATQSFDFGITHVPLLLTVAILVGGVVRMRLKTDPEQDARRPVLSGRASVIVATVGLVGLAVATWDLHAAGIWQRMMIDRRAERRIPIHERKELDQKIDRLTALVKAHPRDAMAHRVLSQLLLDRQQQLGALQLLEQQAVAEDAVTVWSAPSNVRRAAYSNQMEIGRLLFEDQDADQWRLARQHAITSMVLSPLDDVTRVLVIETDFVDRECSAASGEVLQQTARLRPQSSSVLKYLESLAKAYPAGETLKEIQAIKNRRLSKK